MATLIFGAARTIDYWQAWAFLAVYFAASIAVVLYLMKHDRALLERRMSGGPLAEKEKAQRIIMLFASAGFIALLVVPGLDHRFGWSSVPLAVVILGNVLILAGWLIIFAVFRENSFTSATIEIARDQTVISTGPYGIVRHPMYAGALLLFLGIPLSLASYWGLAAVGATMPFLLWRIFEEEKFLRRNLAGYEEYCTRMPWRLIPGIF